MYPLQEEAAHQERTISFSYEDREISVVATIHTYLWTAWK